MPYDNKLWRFGPPILQMLARGAPGENTLVVVVSDLSGEEYLTRRIITKGQIAETHQLPTADSSSVQIYAEQLEWIRSRFDADRWAVIFLGHSGRLDEVSPDERPVVGKRSWIQWMNIVQLADVLSEFNRGLDNRMQLLFLQNCCKGTIEVHYGFRNSAKFTLSSQTVLGAPNYYYEGLLHSLIDNPCIPGAQLAERIMKFERDDMYNGYTVTDNQALAILPSKIEPLLEAILRSGLKAVRISELDSYNYAGDRLVDAVAFFRLLGTQTGVDPRTLDGFVNFLTTSVICNYHESPKTKYRGLSGLSLLLPSSREQLENYRYMEAFSELKLVDLLDGLLR
jgi:hypothetical protein